METVQNLNVSWFSFKQLNYIYKYKLKRRTLSWPKHVRVWAACTYQYILSQFWLIQPTN